MDTVEVELTREEFFGGGGGRSQTRRVFIAYRFEPESEKFKEALSHILAHDWEIEIRTGRDVPGGSDWSRVIQKRIDESKLIVADVTDTSREVMFEIGYAGNKPALYVVRSPDELRRLPRWLTIRQLMTYEGNGIREIGRTIGGYFAEGRFPQIARRGSVPGRAVLVRDASQSWSSAIVKGIEALLGENGIHLEHCDVSRTYSGEDLADFASAQFVFACIDGTSTDYLSHFYLGDVAGRRTCGTTSKGAGGTVKRYAMVLSPSREIVESRTADSVRRVGERGFGSATTLEEVIAAMEPRLRKLREWHERKRQDSL